MASKNSPYEIQKKAIASLKAEFEQASFDALGKIHAATMLAVSAQGVQEARDVGGFRYADATGGYNLAYARERMQFLLEGQHGNYKAADDYLNVNFSVRLWGDYLVSINRHANGFGSIPSNENTIEELIAQNGAKKMEKRLTSYLKRRIKDTVEKADYGIAPKSL